MVDDTIPANAFFLQTQLDKRAAEKSEISVAKPTTPITKEQVEEATESGVEPVDPDVLTNYNLGLEKLRLANKKAQEDLEISRMKKEKMAGELIPTELVLLLFASHFKSVTTSFHQAIENLLTTIAKQNDLNREAVAKIRGELIEVINKAVKDGLQSSKRDVASLVREYSQKKGKGDKE